MREYVGLDNRPDIIEVTELMGIIVISMDYDERGRVLAV